MKIDNDDLIQDFFKIPLILDAAHQKDNKKLATELANSLRAIADKFEKHPEIFQESHLIFGECQSLYCAALICKERSEFLEKIAKQFT